MTVLTILLFLLFSPPAPRDQFEGIILDTTGAAVAGAKIELYGKGFTGSAYSNDSGMFSIQAMLVGSYSIRVIANGFEPYTASVDLPSESFKLTLRVASRADDVVVTTTQSETPLSMLGVSATVIDREEIAHQQAPAIYQLLRDVPGLAVANTSRRGGTTSLYSRGGGKNANLFLVDGIQVNDPGGDFNFAHFMPANVDRIEVVRGPQSASYGSNAAASVIQVISHRGTPEDGLVSGFASIDGGTFASYRYRTGLSGTAKSFDYSLAAERFQTRGSYVNDAYRNLNLSANIGYQFNVNSQLRFTLRTIGSRVGVPNKLAYGLIDQDAFRTDANVISGFRYERGHDYFSQRVQLGFTRSRDYFQDNLPEGPFDIGAIVSGIPGARGSAGVRLVRFLTSENLRSGSFTIPPGDRLVRRSAVLSATAPSRTITERRTAGYQGNWNYSIHGGLGFGYELQQERGVTDLTPPLRNNHGVFVNHQHNISERLFLTESLRLEDNSVFRKKATPRFAVSYLLSAATRLKASAGTGISEPSFLQNFANDPAFTGNRSLRPERSRSFEAGVEQHLWGSALVLEETVFDQRFRDLIVFVPLAPPQISTWINLEGSRARGIESSARLRARWLRVSGQYTFLDTRVTASASPASAATGIGQELPRRPRHLGSFEVTAISRRGFLNVSTNFVGERQDSDGVGFGIVRNPRYQRVDFGGSYALRPALDLYARLENVLNARYEEVLGYTSLRRNAVVGMNVRWGIHK